MTLGLFFVQKIIDIRKSVECFCAILLSVLRGQTQAKRPGGRLALRSSANSQADGGVALEGLFEAFVEAVIGRLRGGYYTR